MLPAAVTRHTCGCSEHARMGRWEGQVTVVGTDMRAWQPPEQADILVSELLGSFGDNELSPECLNGAQRLLAPHGICIPSSYTSFMQPVTAAKLWNDARVRPCLVHWLLWVNMSATVPAKCWPYVASCPG